MTCNRPRSPFVARFIGAANLIPVRVQSCSGGHMRVATADGVPLAIAQADAAPEG